jgi:ABC-type sugar transport system substrate-binding protein
MKTEKLFTLVLVTMIAVIATACGSTQAFAAQKFNIGFCSANYRTPFQVALMNACEAKATALGMNFDKQDGRDDPLAQTTIIQTFITQKKDLIIVVPSQLDSLIPVIAECNAANIPVITVNRTVGAGAKVLTEVNMNCVEGGRMAAELTGEMLDGKGKIAMLLGILGSGPQVEESQGFEEYMKEKCPGIQIVAQQNTDWDKAKAIAAAENLLTRFPAGQLDGIVCQGPDDAAGAIQVIKSVGRTELLGKVIGFDFPKESLDLIDEGSLYGTVHQDPRVQGELAAQIAYDYLSDPTRTYPAQSYHELFKVTKANVDQFRDRTAW